MHIGIAKAQKNTKVIKKKRLMEYKIRKTGNASEFFV